MVNRFIHLFNSINHFFIKSFYALIKEINSLLLIKDNKNPGTDFRPQYTDSRAFCDIHQEYPEAAYNTLKVGLLLGNLIEQVRIGVFKRNRSIVLF